MEDFLVSASTGAMGSVLGKLGTMLKDEYKLLKGVHDDIRFLKEELQAMNAFLIMMAGVEEPDEQSKLRADAVREMSYEIEDSIDNFMILVEHEPPSSHSDCFHNICDKIMKMIDDMKTRHKIAKDVKRIKSQVKEITERYKRYTTSECSRPKHEKVDPRVSAIYKDTSDLVGVDGPRDELVNWISSKEFQSLDKQNVISIVGYGGLGKTTLAKQVYDKLETNYDCRAFVSISRNPDMTKILSSIICQLRGIDYAYAGEPQLIISQIRNFLKDKRYFVIIDDVWDVRTWKTLECAFVRNGCGSVILTTTRIHDVAKSCCSSDRDHVYQIKPLSIADSKKLFFKRVFGSEEKCPPNLKEASEGIIRRCAGLPLAIQALSSLLATRNTKQEWDHVKSSIEFAQGKNSEVDAMQHILSLSYFDLPLHLRSCLLYLTMFPEDGKIQREPLVHKWIAEGLIYNKDGEDLVELGESYFSELINRSLIQAVNIGYDGKASCCQVHDIILDFLIHKSTEENFCTTLSHYSKTDRRIHRISLMGNEDQECVERLDLSHARSLSSFGSAVQLPFFVKSNALRVLHLGNCFELENHHLKDIGRLHHLRYLNICNAPITVLPVQIGGLEFLETLDVSNTRLDELPGSVTRLKRLARLFVPSQTKLPDLIGNMKNLQELWNINCSLQSPNFLEELGKLTDLRTLGIIWWYGESEEDRDNEGKLVSSLYKLEACKLRYLSTTFYLGDDDEQWSFPALNSIRKVSLYGGQLRWFTKWLVSLVNLEILGVRHTKIEQQDIEEIGSISTLQELCLLLATMGLKFEAEAMPNLKELYLMMRLVDFQSAGAGGGFDFGIQHLSSLTSLIIHINIDDTNAADVEAAVVSFERMAGAHPNLPKLQIVRESTMTNLSDDE